MVVKPHDLVYLSCMPYIANDDDLDDESLETEQIPEDAFEYLTPEQSFGVPNFSTIPSEHGSLLTLLFQFLKDLGGTKLFISYDGGHDEGFTRFQSLETTSGPLRLNEIIARLGDRRADILELCDPPSPHFPRDDDQRIRDVFDWHLGDAIATALFEDCYGAGEYSMYGTLIVDLATGIITDDPNARPQPGGHITILPRE